jgi:hypothetical protein
VVEIFVKMELFTENLYYKDKLFTIKSCLYKVAFPNELKITNKNTGNSINLKLDKNVKGLIVYRNEEYVFMCHLNGDKAPIRGVGGHFRDEMSVAPIGKGRYSGLRYNQATDDTYKPEIVVRHMMKNKWKIS